MRMSDNNSQWSGLETRFLRLPNEMKIRVFLRGENIHAGYNHG